MHYAHHYTLSFSYFGHLLNKYILLTDAIFIWLLQVLKKDGIYRGYTCFL